MVKLGYKATDVGAIPEDWDVANIGEFNPFVTSGSRGWAEYYSEFGDPFIRITNMTRDRIYLDQSRLRYVALPENSAEGKRTQLQNEDILISITADIGICSFVDEDLAKPAYINQHIAMVRFDTDEIFPKFVNYFLASDPVQRLFVASSDTGAKAGMNLDGIRSIKFAKPKPDEQKAIAGALSDVDGLIAGLEALVAKKRHLKTATMQQLLTGKTRLPGFVDEWQPQSIIELCERQKSLFDDGDWVEAEHITNEGIRLIQTGNIGIGQFEESTRQKYVNQESFEKLRCKEVLQGDLLICRLADPAGRACVMPDIGEQKVITSVDVTIARPPADKADRRFLAQVMCTDVWFDAVALSTGGTTHKRISRGNLGKIEIMLPKLNEQTAIADVLEDVDLDISTVVCQLAKAKALKQGMMQELLTGRTRLI